MNPTNKPSFKQVALSILIGLMGYVGAYMPILLLLMPALLGFVLAAWGGVCFAFGAATAAALTFGLLGLADGLSVLAVFLPAAFIIGFYLKKKQPYRTAVVAASLALAVGYYCLICLPGVLAGEGPFKLMEDFFLSMAKMLETQAAPLLEAGILLEEDLTLVADMARSMSLMAAEMTVGSIGILSMGFGLLDVLIARMLAKRTVELKPMAPFYRWQLSKQYTVIAFLALGTALFTYLFKLNNAGAVFVAAECVVLLPVVLMGLCFLEFLSKVPGSGGNVRRILTYVCVVLLIPYSLAFLLVIGFIDRAARIRRRVRLPEEKNDK